MLNEIVMGGLLALAVVLVVYAVAVSQSLSVLKRRTRTLEQDLKRERGVRSEAMAELDVSNSRDHEKLDHVLRQVIAHLGLRVDKVVNPNELANAPVGRTVKVQHALVGEHTPVNRLLFPGRDKITAQEYVLDNLFSRLNNVEQHTITSLRNQMNSLADVMGVEMEWVPPKQSQLDQAWPYRYIKKRVPVRGAKPSATKRPRKPKK